jgi:Ca2+-binding EF-hand superfamily protein
MRAMTEFKWCVVVLGTIGLLVCSNSFAAEGEAGKGAGPRMARMDTDGDGVISAEEFPGRDEVFTQLDTDGDGSLTADELIAGRKEWQKKHSGEGREGRPGPAEGCEERTGEHERRRKGPGPRGKHGPFRGDANGDGVITLDEFQGPDEVFGEWDTDGDGSLTREEIAAGWAKRREEMGLEGRPPRRAPEGRRGFGKVDADGDGLISREEFPGPDEVFDRVDADGDGFISEEERASARPPRVEGPPPRRVRKRPPPDPAPDEEQE